MKQKEVATKALMELLEFDTPKDFRRVLTLVLLEWISETEILPDNKDVIVHRMHLLIEFFDKLEDANMA